ncbi:translin-associated protein X [Planococcus citri]|uniref:translin-associated protein X n=1 Tax=Planococcus citri TaxID=170843 RepID=UPI0031F9E642
MNRNRKKFTKNAPKQDSKSSVPTSEYNASNSQVIRWFQQYSQELDGKHDRYERVFKISRDITIESKRLIFFLHTFQEQSTDGEKILQEAELRFINLVKNNFSDIIKELNNLDIYQYLRAYTFGVQEFVEAFSFYHYLKRGQLVTFKEVVEFIVRHFNVDSSESGQNTKQDSSKDSESQCLEKMITDEENLTGDAKMEISDQECSKTDTYNRKIITMVDYVLGLNDLSGELMRYCINKISSGCVEAAFDICQFLSHLYVGMLSVGFVSREYNRKMITVKQCLNKVEFACYTVRVRGSEIPKHMIASVLENVKDETEDDTHF